MPKIQKNFTEGQLILHTFLVNVGIKSDCEKVYVWVAESVGKFKSKKKTSKADE